VIALLAAVAAMSAIDLALTLGFMQTIGMFEDNPIVRLIVAQTESAAAVALGVFKTATVLVSVGVLYTLRTRVQGEIGAWIAAMVLVAVCVQWSQYADAVLAVDPALWHGATVGEPGWVKFD
jgi:hypothetical protein